MCYTMSQRMKNQLFIKAVNQASWLVSRCLHTYTDILVQLILIISTRCC